MWTAVRFSIALATCAVLLTAVISTASPALTLGEAQAAPRLVRESGPIEARMPEEEPRVYCYCNVPVPEPVNSKRFEFEISRLYSVLSESPSAEIEKPFSRTSKSDNQQESGDSN